MSSVIQFSSVFYDVAVAVVAVFPVYVDAQTLPAIARYPIFVTLTCHSKYPNKQTNVTPSQHDIFTFGIIQLLRLPFPPPRSDDAHDKDEHVEDNDTNQSRNVWFAAKERRAQSL